MRRSSSLSHPLSQSAIKKLKLSKLVPLVIKWRHDTQHNVTGHNDSTTMKNGTQYSSMTIQCHYAECYAQHHYAEDPVRYLLIWQPCTGSKYSHLLPFFDD